MVGSESPETPSGELRMLSAADTDFQKVFVVVAATVWLTVAISVSMSQRQPGALLFVLVVGGPLLGLFVWGRFRLKVVETDGSSLFVSTFFETMSLPLILVEAVESGWMSRYVYVAFRKATPFGSEVVFQARASLGILPGGQEVGDELRALVARARSHRSPGSVFEDRDARPGSGTS
jgi:hypothetical protein